MRPATHVLISGEHVRGTRAPDREPTYGIDRRRTTIHVRKTSVRGARA